MRKSGFQVYCITETWLNSDIDSGIFGLDRYSWIRSDRPDRGGGSAILLSNELKYRVINFCQGHHEICAVDILGSDCDYCRLVCVYRPPNYSTASTANLIDTISALVGNSKSYLIVGDFNLPGIDWRTFHASNDSERLLVDFVLDSGSVQAVDEPTHIGGNTLDLMIASDPWLVMNLNVTDPLISDHMGIATEVNFQVSSSDATQDGSFRSFRFSEKMVPYLAALTGKGYLNRVSLHLISISLLMMCCEMVLNKCLIGNGGLGVNRNEVLL